LRAIAEACAHSRRTRLFAAALAASVVLASAAVVLSRVRERDASASVSARSGAALGGSGSAAAAGGSGSGSGSAAGGSGSAAGGSGSSANSDNNSEARPARFKSSSRRLGARTRVLLATARDGALLEMRLGADGSTVTRRLTEPPAGAHDENPRVSPDGTRVLFERALADGRRQLYLYDRDDGSARALAPALPYQWAARFLCNDRVRFVADRHGPAERTFRSAAEHDVALDADVAAVAVAANASTSANASVSQRGAAHLWRVPTSWSRDRCVSARIVSRRNASGQMGLSLEVRSCRGARDRRGLYRRPYREIALWPSLLGINVRSLDVSPDGRFVAVVLDRSAAARPATPGARGLLYVVRVRDDGRHAAREPVPMEPLRGASPGPLRMTPLSRFLGWQRVATDVVARPRWSGASGTLCYLRREARGRAPWCWSAHAYRSARVGGAREARRDVRHAVPTADGTHVALLADMHGDSHLTLVERPAGRRVALTHAIALSPTSAPAWLPTRSRGSPCAR
ncbi:MAG: PD40 domain-containing protein, partial [Myxococcales bacterium]|nr:PD40 domain-containing protein [Myxococcales bacterium]